MPKKIPMRMCVGCREMKAKRELVRIVCARDSGEELHIAVDPTGKAPGRGAYICPNAECLERARKIHALERTFSAKIEDEVFTTLVKAIESAETARTKDDRSEGALV